jgi:hypothetical protein
MSIPLQEIDQAIALGAEVDDWPEVTAARAAQERLSELAAERQRLTSADRSVRASAVVAEFAAGRITADQMVVAVANLNASADHALVNRLFDEAAMIVAEPHRVALHKIGDRWIDALRPAATQRARQFAQVAARLPNRPFHEHDVDPHEWRNLGRALDAWDEVFALAEALGARPEQWLHPERQPERLVHSPLTTRSVAVMMHHAGAEAGVWTRAEVRAAAPPKPPKEPAQSAEPADLTPAA